MIVFLQIYNLYNVYRYVKGKPEKKSAPGIQLKYRYCRMTYVE